MSGTFDSPVLTVDIADHIATVWLDRPEKRNAMGHALWEDLPRAMAKLSADSHVRVVVIAAKGPAFSIGLDLIEFGPSILSGADGTSEAAKRLALRDTIKTMQRSFTAVADCPKPVIAAIHGYCLGGGIDLITACDIRLASSDAVFSVRETRIAIVADVGTLQRLPRIVDPGRVAELVYTGADYSAAEAHEMGLVGRVYPDAPAVQAAASDMAAAIAANSPLAVQGAKAVLRATEHMSISEALDYVAVWNSAFLESNDLMEAIQSFTEKREPRYSGT